MSYVDPISGARLPTPWGAAARDMPDECRDVCAKTGLLSVYFPFRWAEGRAHYQCSEGHRWACGWDHEESGEAPDHRGMPVWQEQVHPWWATNATTPSGPAVHAARALGRRRGEDEATHERGPDQGHLLRHEAADREPQQVDHGEPHRVQKVDRVSSHLRNRRRGRTARCGDSSVVERHDPTKDGECVQEGGIPVVEVASEVLEDDQGDAAPAEVSVGVVDPVGCPDHLGRSLAVACVGRCARHLGSLCPFGVRSASLPIRPARHIPQVCDTEDPGDLELRPPGQRQRSDARPPAVITWSPSKVTPPSRANLWWLSTKFDCHDSARCGIDSVELRGLYAAFEARSAPKTPD